jgi:hypothetical protein
MVIAKRAGEVIRRLEALPQLNGGGRLPQAMTDVVQSEAQLQAAEIEKVVQEEIESLNQLLESDPDDADPNTSYVAVDDIGDDVASLVTAAAEEIKGTLGRSIENCGERLTETSAGIAQAIERWTEQLANLANDFDESLDRLESVSVETWIDASKELRTLVASMSNNLRERVTSIQNRIEGTRHPT